MAHGPSKASNHSNGGGGWGRALAEFCIVGLIGASSAVNSILGKGGH